MLKLFFSFFFSCFFIKISHVYDVPFGAVRVFCNLSNGIETVFGKPGGNLHVEGVCILFSILLQKKEGKKRNEKITL